MFYNQSRQPPFPSPLGSGYLWLSCSKVTPLTAIFIAITSYSFQRTTDLTKLSTHLLHVGVSFLFLKDPRDHRFARVRDNLSAEEVTCPIPESRQIIFSNQRGNPAGVWKVLENHAEVLTVWAWQAEVVAP